MPTMLGIVIGTGPARAGLVLVQPVVMTKFDSGEDAGPVGGAPPVPMEPDVCPGTRGSPPPGDVGFRSCSHLRAQAMTREYLTVHDVSGPCAFQPGS
jgi:hypothetical protein